jgi:plasmid maintenance system antidote protein VapI
MYKVKSNELRLFIKNKKLSLTYMAECLKIHPNSVSRQLSNDLKWSLNQVILISKMLDMTLIEFIEAFIIIT